MKKSLSLNAAMSAFKTLMNIIFPLKIGRAHV